ncbi:MAG: Maf family protein [Thermodesulfobacteriota bacterium]
MTSKLVLASSSPRREKLFRKLGLDFKIISPNVVEKHTNGESPVEYVLRISLEKALAVAAALEHKQIVIGADTIVVCDGDILGKPEDEEEAKSMLMRLSGRYHEVMTGLSIVNSKGEIMHTEYVKSMVKFKSLKPDEIEEYVNTKEPLDKAGGYAAQGIGAFMIEEIQGSFTNVVGLPLSSLSNALKNLGII